MPKAIRKILRNGGSKVIALPTDWLAGHNLHAGDVVDVLYGSLLVVNPKGAKLNLSLEALGVRNETKK